MNPRILRLPDEYLTTIEAALRQRGYTTSEPRKLAACVQKLSDHYLANPEGKTPWDEPWAQAASIAYYFPLNFARNAAVATEGKRLGFFDGIGSILDFGSGMGSALHAFRGIAPGFQNIFASDVSRGSLDLNLSLSPSPREIQTHVVTRADDRRPAGWNPKEGLLVASYVLTELPEVPRWWLEAEALALIEPSTQQDARRLMALREDLMEAGYSLWAPCTHHEACPLYIHSQRDWCHDRIHWRGPDWFEEMEKHLPMKNRTLTFSYLLARKKSAPLNLRALGRLVGDRLEEKGKCRQALCRGPEREFLAWFPQRLKKGEKIELERGHLVGLKPELAKKSSEVRLPEPDAIIELGPEEPLK